MNETATFETSGPEGKSLPQKKESSAEWQGPQERRVRQAAMTEAAAGCAMVTAPLSP